MCKTSHNAINPISIRNPNVHVIEPIPRQEDLNNDIIVFDNFGMPDPEITRNNMEGCPSTKTKQDHHHYFREEDSLPRKMLEAQGWHEWLNWISISSKRGALIPK